MRRYVTDARKRPKMKRRIFDMFSRHRESIQQKWRKALDRLPANLSHGLRLRLRRRGIELLASWYYIRALMCIVNISASPLLDDFRRILLFSRSRTFSYTRSWYLHLVPGILVKLELYRDRAKRAYARTAQQKTADSDSSRTG